MLQISKLLERVGQAKFVSTLDLTKELASASSQWRPTENILWHTLGPLRVKSIPFSLHGPAAMFQRLIDWVIAPHQGYAVAYIDNIIIYSEGWEQHLRALRLVLQELWLAGLMASPRKCTLGKSETKYLGFSVRQGNTWPLTDKIEMIKDYASPQTWKQTRAFLGLASYFWHFISHFAEVTTPLTNTLNGKVSDPIKWDETQLKAFHQMKIAPCRDVVLKTPDFKCPFVLQMPQIKPWELC